MTAQTAGPARPVEENLRLLATSDLGGAPNGGEGMAIRVGRDGRRYLFVAHVNPPAGFSILDVSDPARPSMVFQRPADHDSVRTNNLSLVGDTLMVASQVRHHGAQPAGVRFFDVADPTQPREIAFFDTSGPESRGAHFVSSFDGELAHLSTGAPDFQPVDPRDDQFYMIVDIRDPARPHEVGRWSLPGQDRRDDAVITRHTAPSIDQGFRPHHTMCYPARPDRAYLGYIDAGVIILDIADKAAPRLVGRLDYHPPMPGFTHTVVPIHERDLLIVSDEASGKEGDDGYDWPKRIWVVDASVEASMAVLSTAPQPANFAELHREGGRIGAHNIHENEPLPGVAQLRNVVIGTWFSAGLRMYDISDPFTPEEIAAFVPVTPPGQRGSRLNDVMFDDRGIAYAVDRVRGGLYILEYTGKHALA